MKEQILQLKNQGLTIQQIAQALNCSRANVSYHTDATAKEKTLERIKHQREIKKASRALKLPKIKVKKVKPIKVKEKKVKPLKKTKKDFKPETKQTRVFKTKDQNLKEKIAVKLNDSKNTIVFTYPGYNLEKLRAKYLK